MTRKTPDEQRTRLAATLLSCPPTQIQQRLRAMTPEDRANLTGNIDWMVDYEAAEAEQAKPSW